MKVFFFIVAQYLIPHHLLSRAVAWFAQTKITWIKSIFIKRFHQHYQVDLSEAVEENIDNYASFNDFFCRQIKTTSRPICQDSDSLTSPADGAFSQLGRIEAGRIFQAKGRTFTTEELLGGDRELSQQFQNGNFSTIYLSPKDYHRVHMPITGKLATMIHVPGALFSVNPATTQHVPKLFARNERVICVFETKVGPVAIVLVGAMIVASIDTVWAGQVAPIGRKVTTFKYNSKEEVLLQKGQEIARFKLGSTVILLLPEGVSSWKGDIVAGSEIKMGENIGSLISES